MFLVVVVTQESLRNLQILGLYLHIQHFAKNKGTFFSWDAIIKLGKYFVNFEIIVVSDGFIFCKEVQFCFHHSQTAVEAESLSKENHVCLRCQVSMARLCLLSLHNVNALLWYVVSLGFSRREVYVFEWICVIG